VQIVLLSVRAKVRQIILLASTIVTMVPPPQLSPHTIILATRVQLINKVFVYAMARYFVVNNQTMGVLGRRNGAKLHDRFFTIYR
jgi:hypothetical protein